MYEVPTIESHVVLTIYLSSYSTGIKSDDYIHQHRITNRQRQWNIYDTKKLFPRIERNRGDERSHDVDATLRHGLGLIANEPANVQRSELTANK